MHRSDAYQVDSETPKGRVYMYVRPMYNQEYGIKIKQIKKM
jgi:hypothetical protein